MNISRWLVVTAIFGMAIIGAPTTQGTDRPLTQEEVRNYVAGDYDKICFRDPRCSEDCQENNPVSACGVTNDPGTCVNQTRTIHDPTGQDLSCSKDAPFVCRMIPYTGDPDDLIPCSAFVTCVWHVETNSCVSSTAQPTSCLQLQECIDTSGEIAP